MHNAPAANLRCRRAASNGAYRAPGAGWYQHFNSHHKTFRFLCVPPHPCGNLKISATMRTELRRRYCASEIFFWQAPGFFSIYPDTARRLVFCSAVTGHSGRPEPADRTPLSLTVISKQYPCQGAPCRGRPVRWAAAATLRMVSTAMGFLPWLRGFGGAAACATARLCCVIYK